MIFVKNYKCCLLSQTIYKWFKVGKAKLNNVLLPVYESGLNMNIEIEYIVIFLTHK